MKKTLILAAFLSVGAKCTIPNPIPPGPTPRPTVTATPTETPAPSPDPTPQPSQPPPTPTPAIGCGLPQGTGSGDSCPRLSSGQYVSEVTAAIRRVQAEHPGWFTNDLTMVHPEFWDFYYSAVVENLWASGFCAFLDPGAEIALKRLNTFSEQYAVLASDGRVRIGDNTYRATCTPAWKEIPAGSQATPSPLPTETPTTTPPPAAGSCPCLVIATVAHLGINDGPPPDLHPGDTARLDTTLRWACSEGDGRGQPCDKTCDGKPACQGRKCEPATDPVRWDLLSGPGDLRVVNDGYGALIRNLQSGHYVVKVVPTQGSHNQEGEIIKRCPWSPGSSVSDTLTFDVP